MFTPRRLTGAALAILTGLTLTATSQESWAKADPFRHELRQAATTQRGLDQKALKTLSDLGEMATELDYNRLQGSPVHKHITHLNGVLARTQHKYMSKAAKDLQGIVYTKRASTRKEKLDEITDLQGMILQMLDSIRNAKLATGATRIQHKFQMALGDQENALSESKRLIFDAKFRIPMGRSPKSLKKAEIQRLKKVTGSQRMAEESLLAAIIDLKKAINVQSKNDPDAGKKLTDWLKMLEKKDTVAKSKQASRHLLNNMVTQAMKTEQEVIDDISELVGRMAGRGDEGAEGYRQTDFDQLKSEVEQLAERQKAVNIETDKIVAKKDLVEAELRMVEARQHQLIDDTSDVRRMLSDVPLAKVATEQARTAMLRAEKKLARKYPGDAQPHQKTALQALSAAVLALATSTIKGDEFDALDEEQLKRDTEAITALIKGVSQLLAKQEPLRDKTAEVNKSGGKALARLPALAKAQGLIKQETANLKTAERVTFELSEETQKIIELAEQTLGVGVVAMDRAVSQMARKRPGFAVQNQEMAIRQLKEAGKLLQATEEQVKGKLKAARMQAKAIMMTKMAAIEADMIAQIDEGVPLDDVRNVQEKFLKELAEFPGIDEGEVEEVKEALDKAQNALEQAQIQMQEAMSPVADAMQTAAQQLQMAALASNGEQAELLNQMASNQVALAKQAEEEMNPEKLPGWDEMQQKEQDALVEMMDAMPLDTGAGPPADEAVGAMEEAMEEIEKVQKKAEELIIPPVEEAKVEMLAAMSTMQTAATEQFQVAQKQLEQAQAQQAEAEAAAKYREEKLQDELAMLEMPEAGPGEQGGQQQPQPPKPPKEGGQDQGPPGQKKEGQGGGPGGSGSADLLEVEFGEKWTVDFGKRKRLGFEQRIQRALPVEYRGIVEGYFRRLAVEGSN